MGIFDDKTLLFSWWQASLGVTLSGAVPRDGLLEFKPLKAKDHYPWVRSASSQVLRATR